MFSLRLSTYARMCISFAILIGLGFLALNLPGTVSEGHHIRAIDHAFTCVSAVCVTGLSVISVGHDYTFAGQFIILALIQIGGLGFMTLSSTLLMQLRQKATISESNYLRESLAATSAEDLPRILFGCMRLVAVCEGVGAALLFARFCLLRPGEMPWLQYLPQAGWQAIFHSVSAFCNAGFSTWEDNLCRFAGDWWVNLTICGLIVSGGLGFLALVDIETWLRSRAGSFKMPFQTKVVLLTTIGLIIAGTLLIWLGERMNASGFPPSGPVALAAAPDGARAAAAAYPANLTPPQQWLVALFHSVSARTAGFNTVDLGLFSDFSLAVLILLMFIGASPGSAGGGVKTTTFAVLFTQAIGSLRPGREPAMGYRSFGRVTVRSAIVLFFVAGGIVLLGTFYLLLVETGGTASARDHGRFLEYLFEATSALGTVGLSTGITAALSDAGKIGLMVLMYLGRVGPLGLVSASLVGGARPAIRYPEEDVQIG